jgi:1,4-dihydroxy-2-naphthoate octaprenyltransferase
VVGWLLVGTACGFAYNLALKDSAWSWAPYVAAFAALPLFVWAATHSFRDEFLWLYAIGAPLAVAAHLANTLPDIAGDTAAGSRGVAVRLGRERALVALFACLVLSPLVVLLSLIWLDYDAVLLAAAVVAYLALLLTASAAYRQTPFERGAALGFRIIAPAAVILAAGWLAAL